ncbi:MAG: hypothetical protein IK086_07225 [Clostridia bacterium]|nr:hypothetical protein [Clostridia bacterium]
MKKKNFAVRILLTLFIVIFSLPVFACANVTTIKEYTKDKLDPPEVTTPQNRTEMPVYPPAPLSRPGISVGVTPSVYDYYSSNQSYAVEELFNGSVSVSYDENSNAVTDWAYVGAYVSDYDSEYSYFKMKFNASGVESVTVQAIYYEQYERNYPAVTILNERVADGDNLLAVNMNDIFIIDEACHIVSGQYLKNQQIIGIAIFIDSNPKMVTENRVGELSLTEAAFVDKSDEDLAILNMPPRITGFSHFDYGAAELTVTDSAVVPKTKNATFSYTASAGTYPCLKADIAGYKSDYDGVRMKLTGQNVKSVSIGIQYTLGTTDQKFNFFDGAYGITLKNGETESFDFDFSMLEELKSDFVTTVPGSYVKFLKPNQLLFFIDSALEESNSGTLLIEDVEFFTNVVEGAPKVGNWIVSGSGIEKSNINPGGFATITYSQTQGWNNISVAVRGYSSEYCVMEMNVRFYGAKNLGIALAYSGDNFVIQASSGRPIPGIIKDETTSQGEDALGSYTQYKLTFDFSEITVIGGPLTSKAITAVFLYIDAVDEEGNDLRPGPVEEGERVMVFSGIEFKKKQV